MKEDKKHPGSLYLTYDSNKRLLHASRQGEGTTGFLQYMRTDMTYVLQSGYNPNLWMAHYDFPDQRKIPAIREQEMEGYLDTVALAAEAYAGRCRHTVSMGDTFFCITKGIIPLTPSAERSLLMRRSDYPDPLAGYGANMPRPNAVMPEYRAYQALETQDGVLLFSYTPEGERQRKTFEQYTESNFFNPAAPGGKLRYHEIIADPFRMQGQVDRLTPRSPEEKGISFKEAYTDPSILEQGRCIREFDLTANNENLLAFQQRDHLDLPQNKRMLDMTLGELLKRFVMPSSQVPREQMLCVENIRFEASESEVTYKKRI